jgi:hypothetical protein
LRGQRRAHSSDRQGNRREGMDSQHDDHLWLWLNVQPNGTP